MIINNFDTISFHTSYAYTYMAALDITGYLKMLIWIFSNYYYGLHSIFVAGKSWFDISSNTLTSKRFSFKRIKII